MILILGGSGAYFLDKEQFGEVLWIKRIETPFGLSNPIYRIKSPSGIEFLFLSRHGEKDYELTAPFVNYRANIYAAKKCGVERIVAWTGPGSIREEFKPGDYVIPDDLIDFTKKRDYTFFENRGLGFVRQNPVFCPEIRDALKDVLYEKGFAFHVGGTYVCTEGPRLETPAEIRMFKGFGGDLVGMTLVPEVFLAKELEMCYGAICYVTNYAEGIKPYGFKAGVLFEGMLPEEQKKLVDKAVSRFPEIMLSIVERLTEKERRCPCKDTMKRYKLKGVIGDNWETWF
ncbi:MTAP family purine nucleoside phosphorylase [Desulfurobacterium indicum]|uniref:Probable 6-oxopurine nucleoside phosphorylase n=1 Tax=Desulfurobacterium indicum TaxID=1914305 RepID=A0A1R1MM36_9BACT|nr:MTAP family purine nucleoside phosphorylase [Desulfurobacterium indicum]OMH40881.1 phosphorylase [Desulfurobacterium indicum]